ncbi:MAG: succinylglutamate desuccinylase/aspartoacylase family protein [Desulfobacterales bacterium]|nr:succinylglutamate desuccinylase/aspartoacylase family protein [Desulfobacterales bacterium]
MQPAITIASTRIKPGQQVTLQVPVARLYTHTPMAMTVHVIHGRKDGPRLFVSGAIHGDEIIGTEIVRRLIGLKKIKSLRGTLIAVPVVNVYAFVQHSRYSPDRRDLNRFFPGSEKGSLTSRLADTFMEEIVKGSQYGIDLHAGSNHRANLPQIRADIEDEETFRLAKAFQVPVVINATTRDGSLRQAAADEGVCSLLYEGGEALRFDEVAVRAGLRGVLAVMAAVGMLRPPRRRKPTIEPLIADSTSWVRAPASGILRMTSHLGGKVAKNSRIGIIADPFGATESDIHSPVSGMVIGRLNLPLVHEGDAVIHIGHLDRLKGIEPIVEEFREEITDNQQI